MTYEKLIKYRKEALEMLPKQLRNGILVSYITNFLNIYSSLNK